MSATRQREGAELTDEDRRLDHAAHRRGFPTGVSHGKVPLQDVVEVALAFLERSTARAQPARSPCRGGAHRLRRRSCARSGRSRARFGEALRFIRERVESLQVAAERPRPGHLYACRLAAGGILRPSASLRRRPRRRPSVSDRIRGSGAARRRARRDLAGAAAVDRQDRRSGVPVLSRLATWGDGRSNVASTEPASREPANPRTMARSAIRAATPASSARPTPRG